MQHATVRFPIGTPVTICQARPYNGCAGRVVGMTRTLPSWFIVQLDDGSRVVVRPGHFEAQAQTQAQLPSRAPLRFPRIDEGA